VRGEYNSLLFGVNISGHDFYETEKDVLVCSTCGYVSTGKPDER
jgi:rubrerythrin